MADDIAALATKIHNERMELAMKSASTILGVTKRILQHPDYDLVNAAHIEIKQRPNIDHAEVRGVYKGYGFKITDDDGRAIFTDTVMLVFDAVNCVHRFSFSGPDEFAMNMTHKIEYFESIGVEPEGDA